MPLVPAGGVRLNVEDDMHSDGRPACVLLHGFAGSLEDWDDVAPALRRAYRVVAVDLPGHGRSDAPDDPAPYSTEAMARHVASALEAQRVQRAVVVGYSLGARVAMRLALGRPDLVQRLALEGASPGLDGEERAARAEEDARWVRLLREEGIAAFVDRWLAQPFLGYDRHPRLAAVARADRLRRDPRALARALENGGQGAEPSLWPRLAGLAQPATLVVGERDAKYRAIAERMARSLPDARIVVVEGAAHAPHRDAPGAFVEALA